MSAHRPGAHCTAGHTFTEHAQAGCAACRQAENDAAERNEEHKHELLMEACDERDEARALAAFEHARWLDCARAFAEERERRQALEEELKTLRRGDRP